MIELVNSIESGVPKPALLCLVLRCFLETFFLYMLNVTFHLNSFDHPISMPSKETFICILLLHLPKYIIFVLLVFNDNFLKVNHNLNLLSLVVTSSINF